jgi:hypothetical protein
VMMLLLLLLLLLLVLLRLIVRRCRRVVGASVAVRVGRCRDGRQRPSIGLLLRLVRRRVGVVMMMMGGYGLRLVRLGLGLRHNVLSRCHGRPCEGRRRARVTPARLGV